MYRKLLLSIAAILAGQSLSAQTVIVNVDAGANRHPIDPRIYGVAWAADTATVNDLGITLNRWGGNAVSRHNWEISTTNRAKDYFFLNIPDDVGAEPIAGGSADKFIGMTRAGVNGVQPVMTMPMMFLLPKERTKLCSYSVALYGPQDATAPSPPEPPGCGNGKQANVRMKGVNDPADTAATYTLAHQTNWIDHMIARWGNARAGGMRYYSLDNEPSLWSFDHWDVHPNGATYDEVWGKMRDFGAAIRARDANAAITGPEEWGWSGYFMSGLDQEGGTVDRDTHGGARYIDWLLQQAKAYHDVNGARILDVLTVHFYPQGPGEFGENESVSDNTRALRNRSTRSLWDPAYVNESWIGMTAIDGGVVKLIPRLKQWVADFYPGTKIGITEYNWGAERHINGATAQADILGIFGREGLDMAVRWTSPDPGWHVYNAFKMYRNYDGMQSRFGDISVSAGGPNPDVVAEFAAVRSTDSALTIMLVDKTAGAKPTTVNLQNFVPFRAAVAQRRQLDSGNAINPLANVALAGNSLSLTLPGQSITLLVIPGATLPGAPVIGAGTPEEGSATINFTAPASDGGADIISYVATCNPGTTASAAQSPITVHGLTKGTPYNCTVAAMNAVGTGPSSSTVRVTPAVPPGAASALIATATSISQVSLTWTAGAGAINYEIYRSFNGSAYAPLNPSAATTYNDNGLAPNTTYLYKVRAMNGGGATPFSEVDAATTIIFTDDPLTAGTPIKAIHVTQLRIAVNAMRSAAGLANMPFTDPGLAAGTVIKALHVSDLRTGLDAARASIGLPALVYTDPAITAGSTTAKTAHAVELRSGVK